MNSRTPAALHFAAISRSSSARSRVRFPSTASSPKPYTHFCTIYLTKRYSFRLLVTPSRCTRSQIFAFCVLFEKVLCRTRTHPDTPRTKAGSPTHHHRRLPQQHISIKPLAPPTTPRPPIPTQKPLAAANALGQRACARTGFRWKLGRSIACYSHVKGYRGTCATSRFPD